MSEKISSQWGIAPAFHRPFEEQLKPEYNFIKLSSEGGYDRDFLDHVTTANAAGLGLFAVGNKSTIEPHLVISEEVATDDYGLGLAQIAIEEGLKELHGRPSLIPNFPSKIVDKVFFSDSLYFDDKKSVNLAAGVYALTTDNGESYEPWLAYNKSIEDGAFYIREIVLRKSWSNNPGQLTRLGKSLLNPDEFLRSNIAQTIVGEVMPANSIEYFKRLAKVNELKRKVKVTAA